jgi:hypothetical protein
VPSFETILAAATTAAAALSGVASLGWWLAGRFTKQDRYFSKILDEHAKEDRDNFEDVRTRIMRLELSTEGQTHSGRFPRR